MADARPIHVDARTGLPTLRGDAHDCPYLPGRIATDLFSPAPPDDAAYQRLMDLGFRRSGRIVYRPDCGCCHECVPLRVPVADFSISRSQRRVLRKNADVTIAVDRLQPTDEKWRVYASYLQGQHDGRMNDTRESFEQFLYESPIGTLEMIYRVGGRLIGVGIVDVCPDCLSSVYFFFDPLFAKRSPGVFSALCEIEECRRRGLAYWYAGFFIADCGRMNYKARFGPHELLGTDGVWRPANVLRPGDE